MNDTLVPCMVHGRMNCVECFEYACDPEPLDPRYANITVHVCGVKCEHVWEGPYVEFDGGHGVTVTCSKCGAWAINVSMMEGA